MSTNLEYRAREIRWQASEGQRENGRQRSRATDKNFFFWRTTWKFCSGGDKMRNAGSQQANARWTWGAVKKSDLVRTHTPFPPLSVTKKFLEVSRCSHAKQRQRNVQKKCAARVKLLFCSLDLLLSLSSFSSAAFAA